MAYNDDQLFYAAIWWATGIDGAEAYTADVFKAYGKTPIAVTPAKEPNKDHDGTPVSEAQFRVYFDVLYEGLKNGVEKTQRTYEPGSGYMKLERSFATSSNNPAYPDFPYSDVIEMAMAVSGVTRHMHGTGNHVAIHETGQLFVTQKSGERYQWQELPYPGAPEQPFASAPVYTAADMKGAKPVVWETFYRVVPLEEGQVYQSGWIAVDGNRYFHEGTARAGQVLTLGQYDSTVPLASLTDAEIIAGTEKITGSMASDAYEYAAGYIDERHQSSLEATDDPRIVRHLKGPVMALEVTEPLALHAGSSFVIAKPGDRIITEQEGYTPRVIRRESLESGKVRFIPFNPEKPPGVKPPQP
ncbi:MAG TPA: hypothetical protein VEF76_11245 [Patescibacteria group bacterium]|nr:hypothetical protein [Patescibacteria group bacterium]